MIACGIYKLNFKGTDKVYIGKGLNIHARYSSHKQLFQQGTHSIKMMEAYTLYGLPTLEIVLECEAEELNDTEDEVIEIFDAVNNGFNTLFSSRDTPNVRLKGELNPRSKHPDEKIIEVFKLIVGEDTLRLIDIATSTNVSYNVVVQIATGYTHKWLSEVFPEEYTYMLSQKHVRACYSRSAKARGIIYPAIKSPEGVVHTIEHLTNFCKQHSLDFSTIIKLLKGQAKSHKKWTIVT